MPFVLIQFLPTRPSLGLQEFSDRQGETALRFRLRLTGLKRSAPSCKHGSHPFSNPAPCLPQVSNSPPSQLAVGNCMHSEWHLYIWKLCFIFTKILYNVANREFRYPRRARHNIVDALEMEWYFANIHRILVKVEQRFFHRQMTLGHIRLLTASCEGGRPKLSHSDAPGQSD